jgi:hypothetical protein
MKMTTFSPKRNTQFSLMGLAGLVILTLVLIYTGILPFGNNQWSDKNYSARADVFSVSGGDQSPVFTGKLIIDPAKPKIGEKQYFSIWAKDTDGIKEVTLTIKESTGKSKEIPLKLKEGTNKNGKWEGSWKAKRLSQETQYTANFIATNLKKQTTELTTFFDILGSDIQGLFGVKGAYASCTPKTKSVACGSKACGTVSDGCGGTIICGSCISGCSGTTYITRTCSSGTCIQAGSTPNSPSCGACIPKTKSVACGSKACGSSSDGCGGTLSCGSCPSGGCSGTTYVTYSCSSSGTCTASNSTNDSRCCTPKSQSAACGSKVCGSASDGCSGTISCGNCPSDCSGFTLRTYTCSSTGKCNLSNSVSNSSDCGYISNPCNFSETGATNINSSCLIPAGSTFGANGGDLVINKAIKMESNSIIGAEGGDITIGSTITMESGSTIIFNQGKSVKLEGPNAYILMDKTGTVIRKDHLNFYNLTVTNPGTGSGTVNFNPPNMSYALASGTSRSYSYNLNTSVTLTATQSTGSSFAGWTGCTSSSGATCTVLMTVAKNITARFNAVCVPESTSSACGSRNCGTTVNNCGTTVSCGGSCSTTCTSPYTFNVRTCSSGRCTITSSTPNSPSCGYVPTCVPESTSTTCGSRVCGTAVNNCGTTVSCGTGVCTAGSTEACSSSCSYRECSAGSCVTRNTYIYGTRACNSSCQWGSCSLSGSCPASTCSTSANCACVPESTSTTCSGKECGTAVNNCGTTVSCGGSCSTTCTSPYTLNFRTCSSGRCTITSSTPNSTSCGYTPPACVPLSKSAACGSKVCGDAWDNCKYISCGTGVCSAGSTEACSSSCSYRECSAGSCVTRNTYIYGTRACNSSCQWGSCSLSGSCPASTCSTSANCACVPAPNPCGGDKCGTAINSCGTPVSCGSCGYDCSGTTRRTLTCGPGYCVPSGATTPNSPDCGYVPPCTPLSQSVACSGRNCGSVDNGCNTGSFNCGSCPNDCSGTTLRTYTCSSSGSCTLSGSTSNSPSCGYVPPCVNNCGSRQCGSVNDSCGISRSCGSCPNTTCSGTTLVTYTCSSGGSCTQSSIPNSTSCGYVPPCVNNCGSRECGTAVDSCGVSKTCGSCPSGGCYNYRWRTYTCSSGGSCSYTESAAGDSRCCSSLCGSRQCGSVNDSCGISRSCGSCPNTTCSGTTQVTYTCSSGGSCTQSSIPNSTSCGYVPPCVPNSQSTTCGGRQCGSVVNNCGTPVSCGSCPGTTCSGTTLVTYTCSSGGSCTQSSIPNSTSCGYCAPPTCGGGKCGTLTNSCGTVNCGGCTINFSGSCAGCGYAGCAWNQKGYGYCASWGYCQIGCAYSSSCVNPDGTPKCGG